MPCYVPVSAMKKTLALLCGLAALAACRESNTSARSAPSLGEQARVLRYDTTFIDQAPQPIAYRYVANLSVGNQKQVTIPVEIAWTTTRGTGCPQVASVQVYQLNGDDRRSVLAATAVRDAVCRTALLPEGKLGRLGAGSVMVKLTGTSREVHRFTTTNCLLNGLGYHDAIGNAPLN